MIYPKLSTKKKTLLWIKLGIPNPNCDPQVDFSLPIIPIILPATVSPYKKSNVCSGGTALSSPIYGQGIDKPIWGTNWNCSGTELGLDDCQFDGWGVNVTCSHLKDATVDCLPKNTEESRDSGECI